MRTRKLHPQAGVIITLFAITAPVLLGLLVLAIDCGNLYLTRTRLTKVARVTSATALNMMALRGWGSLVADPETPPHPLGLKTAGVEITPQGPSTIALNATLQEMRQAALDALEQYYPNDFNADSVGSRHEYLQFKDSQGNLHDEPTISTLDRLSSSVNITLRYAVRTYMLASISQIVGAPGVCGRLGNDSHLRCWTESAASLEPNTGRMKSANIFMLLDVSGSMNEQVSGKAKSTWLVEAAAKFIDMFNPYLDRFAVIPYATTADTGQPPQLALPSTASNGGGPGLLPVKTDIEGYPVGGQTNHCDALIQVIRTIGADAELQDKKTPKFVLLFSDGAPNVYRLNFCSQSGADAQCGTTPPRLDQAMTAGGVSGDSRSAGWYGWTVKWDRREVYHPSFPTETCDSQVDDSTGSPSGISDCDPVWQFPIVRNIDTGEIIDYPTIRAHLRLNEDGEFIFKGSPYNGATLQELGFGLQFKNWSGAGLQLPDYRYPDAYKWNGPSYLVHSSFSIPMGLSLIDRIPAAVESSGSPAITCGPGSRKPFPGALASSSPDVADKYAHSRYFASRVVNENWSSSVSTGLNESHRENAPSYFDRPHTLNSAPSNPPGCLSSLSASIPFTDAEIHVGNNFVSNPANVATHGEAVKTAELPYYCALRAADWLRSQYNVVIFTVGLGQSAGALYGNSCEDPLQNALDPNSRKDRFLRRLAFTPESLADPAGFFSTPDGAAWTSTDNFNFSSARSLGNCTNHPLAGLSVESGYSEVPHEESNGYSPSTHQFSRDHLGAYYGANNPEELKLIFGEIAKRMLLRLAT